MPCKRIALLTFLAATGAANASEMWFDMPQAFAAVPVVRIAGAPGTTGTITSRSGFDASFVIGADHTASVAIPSSYRLADAVDVFPRTAPYPRESAHSGVITDNGFLLRTTNPKDRVSAIFDDGGESTSLLDSSALSTSYYAVSSRTEGRGSGTVYLFWSAFSVVGTSPGTEVTITPRGDIHGGHPAGTPFSLTLDAGQAVLFTGTDVDGTSISSTAPVAVFGSHGRAIDFFEGGPLLEQLPGTDAYRTAFVVPTTQYDQRMFGTIGDVATVTAATDSTVVMFNGVVLATLNAGEQVTFDTGPAGGLVTATHPVLLTKMISSAATIGAPVPATPALEWIPGIDQWQNDYTFVMPDAADPLHNYVDVAIATADLGSLTYNGAPVPESACTALSGTLYSTCEWMVGAGASEIWDDNPFFLSLIPYGTDMTFATPADGHIDNTPEPASLLLVAGGLLMLGRRAVRKTGRKAAQYRIKRP